jgi:hypothetical protein
VAVLADLDADLDLPLLDDDEAVAPCVMRAAPAGNHRSIIDDSMSIRSVAPNSAKEARAPRRVVDGRWAGCSRASEESGLVTVRSSFGSRSVIAGQYREKGSDPFLKGV